MKNEFGIQLDSNGYAPSILQYRTDCQCYRCGTTYDLARHEVYQGVGRRQSCKKYGLWVSLCYVCHAYIHNYPQSEEARELDVYAEKQALQSYNWKTEDFIKIFGKNYI